jgi:hypothetical protein
MERMKAAVQNLGKPLEASLGGNSGGKSIRKTTQSDIMRELLVRLVRARDARDNFCGGGQIRTVDSADMSRVLMRAKVIDTFGFFVW